MKYPLPVFERVVNPDFTPTQSFIRFLQKILLSIERIDNIIVNNYYNNDSGNIDGGSASTIYSDYQKIDGGNANG